MINILENNYQAPTAKLQYKTVCPHCKSVFTFELEDLKIIEKKVGGKRIIKCPCCDKDFDTTMAQTTEMVAILPITNLLDIKEYEDKCNLCSSILCGKLASEIDDNCHVFNK